MTMAIAAALAVLLGWLSPVRVAAVVLAALSIAAGGAWAGWTLHAWRAEAARADEADNRREAERMARQAAEFTFRRVDRDHQDRIRRAEAAAAGARDELERLRLELAPDLRTGVAPACAGVAERAAVASRLLGECAGRYQEVARDAGRYADQVRGWIEAVPDVDGVPP